MRRPLIALLLVLVVLAAAACSEDTAVGEGVDLNIKDQAEGLRLGETTTTTAPQEPAGEGGRAALGDTTTTTTPATTTTTAPARQVALQVSINSDTSGSTQFVPSAARVFVGSLVEFINTDSVPRSVVADGGAFDSGMIPPGGTWRYDATEPGSFNYHDGTRPYAVGTLEVVAR